MSSYTESVDTIQVMVLNLRNDDMKIGHTTT